MSVLLGLSILLVGVAIVVAAERWVKSVAVCPLFTMGAFLCLKKERKKHGFE